jgi:hypothetical protein
MLKRNMNMDKYLAFERGYVTVVLIEKGADIKATDKYNQTIMHFGTIHGQSAAVMILLTMEADVNAYEEIWKTLFTSSGTHQRHRSREHLNKIRGQNEHKDERLLVLH